MIQIAVLLFLFLLYAGSERMFVEGLKNYNPLVKDGKVYGINTIKNDPNHIYTRLTTPGDALYNEKYKNYVKSDIILDMQYFNNASAILFEQTH